MEAGDIVMVVESDKADMDVEAFESGYLAKILVPEGSAGAVGAAVALIVQARPPPRPIAVGAGGRSEGMERRREEARNGWVLTCLGRGTNADSCASSKTHKCGPGASWLRHGCVMAASRLRHGCRTGAARLRAGQARVEPRRI